MLKMNWTEKLQIEVIDEEDGSCTIAIEWDENDPDLAEWTSWGKEGQEEFVMSALTDACKKALGKEMPDWHQDLTEPAD
jgi:hypothetical protein